MGISNPDRPGCYGGGKFRPANSPWYFLAALFRQGRINSGFCCVDLVVKISKVFVFAVRCSQHLTGFTQ